eukprot:scaffold223402_cov28-Tisochrysis_lutea.AAC.7
MTISGALSGATCPTLAASPNSTPAIAAESARLAAAASASAFWGAVSKIGPGIEFPPGHCAAPAPGAVCANTATLGIADGASGTTGTNIGTHAMGVAMTMGVAGQIRVIGDVDWDAEDISAKPCGASAALNVLALMFCANDATPTVLVGRLAW